MHHDRILLVDDDPGQLRAYERFLTRPGGAADPASHLRPVFVDVASGPEEGLSRLAGGDSFAVVVSDYQMPGLDGVRFLERVKERSPGTVRVMLTAAPNLATAIDAVNCGAVFRFLTKPCAPPAFNATVLAALRQHQLIVAEQELLEHTVAGLVRVLMDTVTLLDPTVSTRAYRVRRCVRHIVEKCGVVDSWQLEVAAMLAHFGSVVAGTRATAIDDHPAVAEELLRHIPRFEAVAAMVGGQRAAVVAEDLATPLADRDRVRLGSQILRVAIEFDAALCAGLHSAAAAARLLDQPDLDPLLVRTLTDVDSARHTQVERTVPLASLRTGMILDEDLLGENGVLVMARGQDVTAAMLARMARMASTAWLRTPIRVLDAESTEFEPLPPRHTAAVAEPPRP